MELKEKVKEVEGEEVRDEKGEERQSNGSLAIKARFFIPPEVEVLLPGLALTAFISALALHTGSQLTYVTPLIASLGIGMLISNLFIVPSTYKPGIYFSMRQILRLAVALLGIRITVDTIIGLGWQGLLIAIVPLILTFIFTLLMGKVLKVPGTSALLIATGTSICGAAAILTIGALTRARDQNILVAIASITVFGTFLMLIYPFLFKLGLLPLNESQYGHLVGASVHEVAQVVTAAFAGGEVSGKIGILIKLTRVIALIPLAFIIAYLVSLGKLKMEDKSVKRQITAPLFLLGFALMVTLNSLGFFTPKAVKWIEFFDMFLFMMAMAGMGLETDFRALLKIGFRPFFLSLFATIFISGISLILIVMLLK